MASWAEELFALLLADPEPRGIERTATNRALAWLLVNVPAEWILFLVAVGIIWIATSVIASACSASRSLCGVAYTVVTLAWRGLEYGYRTGIDFIHAVSSVPSPLPPPQLAVGVPPTERRHDAVANDPEPRAITDNRGCHRRTRSRSQRRG